MPRLTLLILVFLIVDEWHFVSTSNIQPFSKEDLVKDGKVLPGDVNISGKRGYFDTYYWGKDSFSPRLISIDVFRLVLVAIAAMVILR